MSQKPYWNGLPSPVEFSTRDPLREVQGETPPPRLKTSSALGTSTGSSRNSWSGSTLRPTTMPHSSPP